MIRRSTWIAIAVLAGLILLAYLIRKPGGNVPLEPTSYPEPEVLFQFALNDLNGVRIEDSTGKAINFVQSDEQLWIMDEPAKEINDQERVVTAMQQLVTTSVLNKLDPAPDADQIGLAEPAYTIILTTKGGSQVVLFIGSNTVTGTGYYVRDQAGIVYVVNKYSIDASLDLLTNPPVDPTPTPEPTKVILETDEVLPLVTPTSTP